MKVYDSKVLDKLSTKLPGTIEDITKDSLIVNTNDYLIAIKEIKLEGKKRCLVRDYLNGINNKKELIGKVLE